MLVINRFIVANEPDQFADRARAALAALAEAPGYLRGELTRAFDDPQHWCLVTEWQNVGSYRRALGRYDVKLTATPLLAQSELEPSAYETLATVEPGGTVQSVTSDRAV